MKNTPGALTILEVSQKQKYIFSSNRLRDNVERSAEIAMVTSADYFEKTINDSTLFSSEKNLVYGGGGHTVMQFDTMEAAKKFCMYITKHLFINHPGLEVFVKCIPYQNDKTPGENIKELVRSLEEKKSIRKTSFHQGTFGVEEIDRSTDLPKRSGIIIKEDVMEAEAILNKRLTPDGYVQPFAFGELGGSKGVSNFIAVVHIDGNGMGKRVAEFYEKAAKEAEENEGGWRVFREMVRSFSEAIDDDYKTAYLKMCERIAEAISDGKLESLDLGGDKSGRLFFPIRRLITSGDDICFVTEGRIGIECAVEFIRQLSVLTNEADQQKYTACAGVAIVHQKYPFYKAYELAEELCSQAKKFGASLSPDDNGAKVSAIDWHVEFGEIKDTLEAIREDYRTADGRQLELRPYIVSASGDILDKERDRQYDKFKKVIQRLGKTEDNYARGKIKNLRTILKQKESDINYYLQYNRINSLVLECYQGIFVEMDSAGVGTGKEMERKVFVETQDGRKRSIIFDAIELMDSFISI